MDDRLSRLEAQLERLASDLGALERRLASLEARGLRSPSRPESETAIDEADPLARLASLRLSDLGAVVALVGRTLVVLAGAYLLRALTDSGRLTAGSGILLGLTFALCWILMADRAGARGRGASAVFHGLAFALIAFPLLFEAVTHFQLLNTEAAAAGLGGCAALLLSVAARRQLQGVAWVATLGVLATAGALMFGSAELGPFALALVLLGGATLWLGEWPGWTALRWPAALAADLTILVLSGRAVSPDVIDRPGMALVTQVLLLVTYLASVVALTLLLDRDVHCFEVVQSSLAVAVGLGGAAYVAASTGGGLTLGLATLGLSAGCYGVGIASVERRGRRRNVYFYTSAGLVFALMGCALIVPRPVLGPVYATLGLASGWAGRLTRRLTLRVHGAVYLVAAALASGLIAYVAYGMGLPLRPAQAPSAGMLGALALSVITLWGLSATAAEGPTRPGGRVPRLVGIILTLGGLLGVAVAWLSPLIAGGVAPAMDGGLVATLRTSLLVGAVLVLAWTARAVEFVEGAWLVYPLLILTGLKFVVEDLRAGRPATLFASFGLYGLALIVGPWLCRRPSGTSRSQP